MAYFTQHRASRTFTDAEKASVLALTTAQINAGTTDGFTYCWEITAGAPEPRPSYLKMFGTIEAANAYVGLVNSFSPSLNAFVL